MKWVKGAKEGIVVAGGQDQGNSLTQLNQPFGIIVDQMDIVHVVDHSNHRIIRSSVGSKEGSIVVGENGSSQQSNQLTRPIGLSFDQEKNLYVVGDGNHQVQKFGIDLN